MNTSPAALSTTSRLPDVPLPGSSGAAGCGRWRGFTLVELLVVVVVIGILSSVAVPVFLAQREKAYDATAVSDVRGILQAQMVHLTDSDEYTADFTDLEAIAAPLLSGETSHGICLYDGGNQFVIAVQHDKSAVVQYYDSATEKISETLDGSACSPTLS